MKEILGQKLSAISHKTFWSSYNRKVSIIIMSLLGAWIVCFPYEGQLLYTLAENYGIESKGLLDISLVIQVVGLIIGGMLIKSSEAARKLILYAIPVCIICTATFFFPLYEVWIITLTISAAVAGVCIAAFGFFYKSSITPDNRFRYAAEIVIIINVLKMIINNISLYISIQTGFAFTIVILGAAWYLNFKNPHMQDKITRAREYDKKAGFQALFLLFLFIAIISIDFEIMTKNINAKYSALGWVTDFYWLIPYVGAAFIMRRLKNTDDRSNVLYVAVGMIGSGFILFLMLNYSLSSFLLVNTVMMGAWAVSDVFWYSILGEMLEMVKSPAKIMSVGFSAVMIGVLLGKLIADNKLLVSQAGFSMITMAVICITLIILPILHRLMSRMIKKTNITETNIIDYPKEADALTEREKEVAMLLLKGRTCRLIAAELYISENTVKTHIKNIYSKLGIKRKSELFNFMMK